MLHFFSLTHCFYRAEFGLIRVSASIPADLCSSRLWWRGVRWFRTLSHLSQ